MKNTTVHPAATFDVAETGQRFPILRVHGTPKEIGLAVGKRFGNEIRSGIDRRAAWFQDLKDFALGQGKSALKAFRRAAQKHAPQSFEELLGTAEGAQIPFEDLLILNLKAELNSLNKRGESNAKKDEIPGCSTVVLVTEDKCLHLHNEDGNEAYRDLMFVLNVQPMSKVRFTVLTYPGILPGNGPGFNSRGVVQTTNYIASREVSLGVGRYFLDRLALEAKSIDEAAQLVTHPERAFAFHHLFSNPEKCLAKSVEMTPTDQKVSDINGLYYHTNHLILDNLKDAPQDQEYVNSSSISRWEVLSRWAAQQAQPKNLSRAELLAPLTSHENAPYSPCRHPKDDVLGFTLATAIFQYPGNQMDLSYGQPCRGQFSSYDL